MGEMLPWCMKEMEYDDIRKERVEIKAIDSSCSSYFGSTIIILVYSFVVPFDYENTLDLDMTNEPKDIPVL